MNESDESKNRGANSATTHHSSKIVIKREINSFHFDTNSRTRLPKVGQLIVKEFNIARPRKDSLMASLGQDSFNNWA